MKILFVSKYFGYKSGFNKAAVDILFSLLKTNHEIVVLTNYSKISLPGKDHNKFKIIKAPWSLDIVPYIMNFNFYQLVRSIIRSLQDITRKNYLKKVYKFNPEIIIVNSFSQNLLSESLIQSKYSIFISHGSVESSKTSKISETNVENTIKIMSKFNSIVFVSKNVMNQWKEYDEINKINSYYIPNCCEEEKALRILKISKKSIRSSVNFRGDKVNIVLVGNVEYRKGHDLIVSNILKFKNEEKNILFHFYGSDKSEYANKLKKTIKEYNIEDHFIFHGYKKNILKYIYASDLLVLPSRGEAFPLVILESMVLRTPVIATNINGIPEMITDGFNGYLFENNNEDQLWEKLIWLINDKELQSTFTDRSYKIYWEKFSRKNHILEYKNLLDSINL